MLRGKPKRNKNQETRKKTQKLYKAFEFLENPFFLCVDEYSICMILVHCASDQIYIQSSLGFETIVFEDVERVFPRRIVQILDQTGDDHIAVINGPGSFTQLRVVCVTLNILRTLRPCLMFVDIPKIAYYKKLHMWSSLPDLGAIFMWQRKKMRLIDFAQDVDVDSFVFVDADTVVDTLWQRAYFLDHISQHPVSEVLDRSYMLGEFFLDWSVLSTRYQWEQMWVDVSEFDIVESLVPRYMMDPQIG